MSSQIFPFTPIMKTNRTISFDLNNDIQESNEDYKNRYIEDEEELAKLKQQIKNYSSELLKKMQKNDDENTFLTDEDEEEKKKRKKIFIPQSRSDFESLRIQYPKYSPHILPYISPNKVKSPSQRFRQRWSYIEQEAKKNDDTNHYNDDIILTHSDDEDFSLNSSNLTPIKKNTSEINQRTNVNSPQSANQSNSLFNGSPNSTDSKYYQQSPKSQKQQNYSTFDQESSSSVIQTQKFKIQNQKIESKEEKQPESPSSKLAKFRKEFEADFPLSSSGLEHDITNNITDSQNSGSKHDFIIEEEEEEISDEMSSILKSPKFTEEEEEKNEIQFKANNTNINNSHEEKNKNHSINEDLNLKDSNKDGSKNKIDSKLTSFSPSQFSEEEEEINFDNDDLINKEQSNNEVDLYNEEESQIEIDLNNEKENQLQNQGKTENENSKFDIQIEEESINEFGIDFNEEDENEDQSQINIQSPKQHIFQSEEESSIDFKIDVDELDEEENQHENQQIMDDFGIGKNEEDEDENQTTNQSKNKIQNKQILNNNKEEEEEENKSDIIMDIYDDDDEAKIDNQATNLNFSSQNDDESKTEFMIDLNETNEEEDSNLIFHLNTKIQSHQNLSNNDDKDDDFDSNNKNLGSFPKNQIDKKNEESPDRKTKESLNFETPKFPKGADSFLESS